MKKNENDWRKKITDSFIRGFNEAKLETGKQYLVGVSGGVDSVFLVHWLQQNNVNFVIAHLNHGARDNAGRDQQFVKSLAQQLNVNFHTRTIDVPAMALQDKLSFEEAARIARYRYLLNLAEEQHYAGVIVGHHADDQVETVLMHLLRGSGIAGLAGMQYREYNVAFSANIPILRPMLGIWREEIERYCHSENLVFVEDETNQDEVIYRNRLRHNLLPLLEEYNDGMRKHLWQTSMIAQETEATLEIYMDLTWENLVISSEENLLVSDLQKFLELDRGLQKMMIRRFFEYLLPEMRDFGYLLTQKTLHMILHPPERRQWQIMGNLYGLVSNDQLSFGTLSFLKEKQREQYPQWEGKELLINSDEYTSLDLSNSFSIVMVLMERNSVKGQPWRTSESDEAWIDVDAIRNPLMLRSYIKGDVFSPFGMSNTHVKLSDYFIDHKIPFHARKNYPIICDNRGILWVVGERIDDRCKITDSTKQILHLKIIQPKIN